MLCHCILFLCLHSCQVKGWAVLLQTYGNLTTEAGLDELASYATGMGPDKGAYILNISSSKTFCRHTMPTSLFSAITVTSPLLYTLGGNMSTHIGRLASRNCPGTRMTANKC